MTLTDRVISLGLLLALGLASLAVLAPFLPAIFWAGILAFSTWPIQRRLTEKLNGNATLSAGILTSLWVLLVSVPLVILALKVGGHVRPLMDLVKGLWVNGLPGAPDWLASVPYVGSNLADFWTKVDQQGADMLAKLKPHAGEITGRVLGLTTAVGKGVFELALSLVFVFFFYRSGPSLAEFIRSIVIRIIGTRADHYIKLVSGSIDRVVAGVMGTAAVQAVLTMVGLVIAGVPGVALLTIATFFLSLIPMGPPLVWLPAVGWLAYTEHFGMAIFLGVWCLVVVGGVDHVLKPILISRGGNLPMIVVLVGVIGGMLLTGLSGVFIGPTVLAVAYSLVDDWMKKSASV